MERRKFLSFGVTALAVSIIPASQLDAVNFREASPKAWEATHSDEAIKELYGSIEGISGVITIKAPPEAENGGSIPVTITSKAEMESIALFQDVNPRSAIAVISVPKNAVVDYSLRIKMKGGSTSNIVVMGKGKDGKLYRSVKSIKVSIGGCGG